MRSCIVRAAATLPIHKGLLSALGHDSRGVLVLQLRDKVRVVVASAGHTHFFRNLEQITQVDVFVLADVQLARFFELNLGLGNVFALRPTTRLFTLATDPVRSRDELLAAARRAAILATACRLQIGHLE